MSRCLQQKGKDMNSEVVDLGQVFRYLSQSKGKLEVTFQKNENPAYESLCLVFIKMPIYGSVVSILREMLDDDKNADTPLSKGKLSIDSKEDNLHAFVGAIRIKSIDKSAPIILSLIERMRGMLKSAIILSKQDNIGNVDISRIKSYDGKKDIVRRRPYTFISSSRGIFNGERSTEETD